MMNRSPNVNPLLVFILDAVIINLSFVLAYYMRFELFVGSLPVSVPHLSKFYGVIILVTFLWLSLFKLLGIYDKKDITSASDEASSIIGATIVGTLVLLALLFLYRGFWFSRGVLLYSLTISSALMILSRYALAASQRELYKRGIGIRRTLIIGTGDIGKSLAEKMLKDRALGYKAVAFMHDGTGDHDHKIEGIPVIEWSVNLREKIKELDIDEVIVANSTLPPKKVLDIIMECEIEEVEFKLVPGILELIASRISTDEIGGIPLLTIKEIRLQGLNAFIKRATDILISLFVILLISPILIFVILAIIIDSRGPVFFSQKRIGKDGKEFDLYKFRSMVIGAEGQFEKVVAETGGDIIRFKAKADPRITRMGKFIRKFSIDELPQILNVLKGDMSLVGPRPPVPIEVAHYTPWHKKRFRIRPGITGLWQVSGRSELPFEDMVRLDIYYIENWSLWMDIRIILRTIPTVIFGSGAY